jgi:hypothetical protein
MLCSLPPPKIRARPFPELFNLVFHSIQDAEGVLVANIGSYMGGVDLWQNEDESYDNFDPQSMHDKILEVVSISGTWHLGKLQVKMNSIPVLVMYNFRIYLGFKIDGRNMQQTNLFKKLHLNYI